MAVGRLNSKKNITFNELKIDNTSFFLLPISMLFGFVAINILVWLNNVGLGNDTKANERNVCVCVCVIKVHAFPYKFQF